VGQVVVAVTGRRDEGNLFRPGQFRSVLIGLDLDRDQGCPAGQVIDDDVVGVDDAAVWLDVEVDGAVRQPLDAPVGVGEGAAGEVQAADAEVMRVVRDRAGHPEPLTPQPRVGEEGENGGRRSVEVPGEGEGVVAGGVRGWRAEALGCHLPTLARCVSAWKSG
jgi:hypothetical protein